jgi:hypothetical protein
MYMYTCTRITAFLLVFHLNIYLLLCLSSHFSLRSSTPFLYSSFSLSPNSHFPSLPSSLSFLPCPLLPPALPSSPFFPLLLFPSLLILFSSLSSSPSCPSLFPFFPSPSSFLPSSFSFLPCPLLPPAHFFPSQSLLHFLFFLLLLRVLRDDVDRERKGQETILKDLKLITSDNNNSNHSSSNGNFKASQTRR